MATEVRVQGGADEEVADEGEVGEAGVGFGGEVGFQFGVADAVHGDLGEAAAELDGLLGGAVEDGEVDVKAALAVEAVAVLGVEVEPTQLLHVGDAEEGVPSADGVVEEGEGPVLGHGDQPQGELGHFHGHGVSVDAVEASLDDAASGLDLDHLGVVALGAALGGPGLDEAGGKEAAGSDEYGAGATAGSQIRSSSSYWAVFSFHLAGSASVAGPGS